MTPPEFIHTDLTGARFERVPLRQARFRAVDFSGSVMRAVSLEGVDIDGDIGGLKINGVPIAPLVEAELRRRQPARAYWNATDPVDLRAAWGSLQGTWEELDRRVVGMPAGTADVSVDDEWSYTQTLRHLVCATDTWFTAPLRGPAGFHPWGLPFTDMAQFVPEGTDFGLDPAATPSWAEVLEVRAERVGLVGAFLAEADAEQLAREVPAPPWADSGQITLLQGVQVIIEEECEHQRFAERDLNRIEDGASPTPSPPHAVTSQWTGSAGYAPDRPNG